MLEMMIFFHAIFCLVFFFMVEQMFAYFDVFSTILHQVFITFSLFLSFFFFFKWKRVGKRGREYPSGGYPAYFNRVDDVLGVDTLCLMNSFKIHYVYCPFVFLGENLNGSTTTC